MSSTESSVDRREDAEAQSVSRTEMAAQSRSLRNSIILLAVFFALVAALLLAVPGLRSVGELITDAQVGWVAAGIGFELLSCAGFVVLFELLFGKLDGAWQAGSPLPSSPSTRLCRSAASAASCSAPG